MFRRALAASRLWLFSVLLWVLALYMLSALPRVTPIEGSDIPHIDKIMHFGYFMGGAFLFATHLLLKHGLAARAVIRVASPILLFAVIGALDEYHQTLTPGRSGNDPFDWLADALGAITGVLLANRFHTLLIQFTSRAPEKSQNLHSKPTQ